MFYCTLLNEVNESNDRDPWGALPLVPLLATGSVWGTWRTSPSIQTSDSLLPAPWGDLDGLVGGLMRFSCTNAPFGSWSFLLEVAPLLGRTGSPGMGPSTTTWLSRASSLLILLLSRQIRPHLTIRLATSTLTVPAT